MEPVKHLKISKDMKISDLVEQMKHAGFQAQKIGRASEIAKKMFKDKECMVFLGIAGAMVPGGMKQIIIDLLKTDNIDVLVTTGANLTHDLIESLGEKHYKGTEKASDIKLREKHIDRIYNVFLKDKVYEKLEDFFKEIFLKFPKKMNIREFLWEIGKNVKHENSILKICYEKKIPIFCPAIADSGIGLMIWGREVQGKDIDVDAFDDLKEIFDKSWTCKKAGVIYVGGGTPKNFIQQSMQFSNKQDGADYGIQITTDRPEPGGSSGAPLEEGISWGKMNKGGEYVDVFCDATIALPLIFSDFL
jgi:deoxyhypusine synthase